MGNAHTLLMTLVGFVAMCFIWRIWKATMREVLRDKLIDLRDEWRDYYVKHSLDMTDGKYSAIRDVLNDMLYGSASLRFVGFWYYMSHIDNETAAHVAAMSNKLLEDASDETRKMVLNIRMRASIAVLIYIATTSIGVFFYVPYKIIDGLSNVCTGKIITCLRNLFTINEDSVVCATVAFRNASYI